MTPKITLTQPAQEYIKKMIAKENGIGFRISIKKTGCSGFSYAPTVAQEVKSKDIKINIDGIDVYIDETWLPLLQHIAIDFVQDKKSGVQQKRLVFTNPKESSRCGCGESFHVSED